MERQEEGGLGAPLLEGLLNRISELMGDGASLAAFRFAAFEEGRRIAGGYRGDDLRTLLERLDAVLGHRTRLLEETPALVRLRVAGSPMLASDRPIVQGIALGVLEGALLVNRGRRYTGRIAQPPTADGVLVELVEAAA